MCSGVNKWKRSVAVGVDRVTMARWETGVRRIAEPIARRVRLIRAEAQGERKRSGR